MQRKVIEPLDPCESSSWYCRLWPLDYLCKLSIFLLITIFWYWILSPFLNSLSKVLNFFILPMVVSTIIRSLLNILMNFMISFVHPLPLCFFLGILVLCRAWVNVAKGCERRMRLLERTLSQSNNRRRRRNILNKDFVCLLLGNAIIY